MTMPAEPLPDDSQDPALDEEYAPEFTLEDMNAVFAAEAEPDTDPEPETDSQSQDEPAATDDPPVDESDEVPSPSDDAAAGEGGVDSTGHAGDDTPPASTPAPQAPQAGTVEIGGQLYRADDVASLIQYVEQLPPEKQALLFGQPEPEPDPRLAPPPEDEIVDPRLAAYVQNNFSQIETKLDAVLQQQQLQQQALARQQEAELHSALDTARRGVAEAHGLTDAEAQRLLEVANQLPAAAAAVQNYDMAASPVEAFQAALETAYWLTPEFRDRAIQSQVTTQVAELGIQNSLSERRELNQSLVGSGAAAPRAQAPKPSTPEEHMAAAVDLVKESLSSN